MDGGPLAGRLGEALARARALQPVRVGVTPSVAVLDTARGTLRRYGDARGTPLLIVYSLVNRAYILDLNERRSVIRRLMEAGFSVHLIDWHRPDTMSRFDTLGDYLADDVAESVDHLAKAFGERPHLLGVCQGGVMALCHAATHPWSIRTLTTLVTPVDFHTDDDHLYRLSRTTDVARLAGVSGNIPAAALNVVFTSLKPFQIFGQRYLTLADIADDDDALSDFLRMERWMYDSPDQAGAAFVEFVREFYQGNGLLRGDLDLGNGPIDLGAITVPVFNAYASDDHLVPPAAASALRDALSHADYRETVLRGGHLRMFISGAAHRRVYPPLVDWLRER